MNETLNLVADWILLAAFPPVLLFVPLYARSPWRSTAAGRALMFQAMGLALVVTVVLLSLFLGADYPGRPLVRIVGFSILSIACWWLLVTLVRVQREGDILWQAKKGADHRQTNPVPKGQTPLKE